jgi:branched-subunit amino acid transport protein
MSVWLAFILGGVVTYLLRASFITFAGRRSLPAACERALKYVSPAVFAAITLPAVFGDSGFGRVVDPDARLFAAVVGGLIAWRTRSVPATLGGGMVALWLLLWVGL